MVGHAWKTPKDRYLGGIQIRCPNHLGWLLSTLRSSSSTQSSLQRSKLLTLSLRLSPTTPTEETRGLEPWPSTWRYWLSSCCFILSSKDGISSFTISRHTIQWIPETILGTATPWDPVHKYHKHNWRQWTTMYTHPMKMCVDLMLSIQTQLSLWLNRDWIARSNGPSALYSCSFSHRNLWVTQS